MNYMMGYYGYYDGFNFMGSFFMILIWVLVIWGIVMFIKMLMNNDKADSKEDRAVAIVRERYAKGEITKQEFEEAIKLLSS